MQQLEEICKSHSVFPPCVSRDFSLEPSLQPYLLLVHVSGFQMCPNAALSVEIQKHLTHFVCLVCLSVCVLSASSQETLACRWFRFLQRTVPINVFTFTSLRFPGSFMGILLNLLLPQENGRSKNGAALAAAPAFCSDISAVPAVSGFKEVPRKGQIPLNKG